MNLSVVVMRIVIISFLLAVSLIFTGCPLPEPPLEDDYYYYNGEPTGEIIQNETANQTAAEEQQETENETIGISQPGDCSTYSSSFKRDQCNYNSAILENNAQTCKEISIGTELRDFCHSHFAVEYDDPSLCSFVSKTSRKDSCYKRVAISRSDASLCSELSDMESEDDCINDVAFQNNDVNLCSEISLEGTRDGCIFEIATNTLNTESCLLISRDEKRDKCLYEIALEFLSEEYCEKIEMENYSNYCYYKVAHEMGDASVCENIIVTPPEERCEAFQNYTICSFEGLYEGPNSNQCIAEIAVETGERDLCFEVRPDIITTEFERNAMDWGIWCYAIFKEDSEICEDIFDEDIEDWCQGNVSIAKRN